MDAALVAQIFPEPLCLTRPYRTRAACPRRPGARRDQIIALDRYAAAERTLQDIRDRDALKCAGIKLLDELHVDVAGQQRELDRAKFSESPALPAAADGDRFVPDRCH